MPALYEADFSAEQPPAQAHARFLSPDADPIGPRRALGAPPQRAQETLGVNSGPAVRETFSRDDRLRKRRDFEECYTSGIRVSGRHLQVFFLPDSRAVRLGLSVPKRLGSAVQRNRARRRLREIFRRNRGAFGSRGGRLVVNVRPSAVGASFEELSADFLSSVGRAQTRTAPPR
jgi:ribonuclease P protein component